MSPSHPLYEPQNRRWLKRILFVLALLALVAELFIHVHAYFDFAAFFAYSGLIGLVATLLLIALALILRTLLQRPEDHYDD